MSRDETHGGEEWGFTKSLWSPAYKRDGSRWRFWDLLLRVQAEDLVLHLRGKGKRAAFVGTSTAEAAGTVTDDRPPIAGEWAYANRFHRVLLKDYSEFLSPVSLVDVFKLKDQQLREYYLQNRDRRDREALFYVVQANRLQCLNGAYFSEVSTNLFEVLFGVNYHIPKTSKILKEVNTGEALRTLFVRMGQKEFSDQVRHNYGSRCCFPECDVADPPFLVAGHIARWSDNSKLRGDLGNGICFCLMHDKAFENGVFTVSLDWRVVAHPGRSHGRWAQTHILPYAGKKIRTGSVLPSGEALREHWSRIKLPDSGAATFP